MNDQQLADATWVLLMGSRNLADRDVVWNVLDGLYRRYRPVMLVQGGAKGTDTHGRQWVHQRHRQGWAVDQREEPAKWAVCSSTSCTPRHRHRRADGSTYCPTAGHYRNLLMVDTVAVKARAGRGVYVAFFVRGAGNRGTTHCAAAARAAGIPEAIREIWVDSAAE